MTPRVLSVREHFQILDPVISPILIPVMQIRPLRMYFTVGEPPHDVGTQRIAESIGPWVIRAVDPETATVVNVPVIPIIRSPRC